MWRSVNITDEDLKFREYHTLIYIGDRDYLKVSNRLVKHDGIFKHLIYKEGFTFDLFHIEYGRFGKRYDVWVRKVDSSEIEKMFEKYIKEPELTLPEVTGKALEELVDE